MKFEGELCCAGLPVFTGPLYGWAGSENGLLMAVLGFASLPLSFLVGVVSPHISDRALTLGALMVTAIGAALCMKAGDVHFGAAYFGGGGMLYMVRHITAICTEVFGMPLGFILPGDSSTMVLL